MPSRIRSIQRSIPHTCLLLDAHSSHHPSSIPNSFQSSQSCTHRSIVHLRINVLVVRRHLLRDHQRLNSSYMHALTSPTHAASVHPHSPSSLSFSLSARKGISSFRLDCGRVGANFPHSEPNFRRTFLLSVSEGGPNEGRLWRRPNFGKGRKQIPVG